MYANLFNGNHLTTFNRCFAETFIVVCLIINFRFVYNIILLYRCQKRYVTIGQHININYQIFVFIATYAFILSLLFSSLVVYFVLYYLYIRDA